ncbi:hypothetical protein SAMN05443287_10860 [Micromonospora phaseoli]|uniref:Uncharacterized protein n=1 Tax=Micromonospora phaseoli TaxID=1144548 RepID=A0A1H7C7L3_9ACTN|nr:hypothetical protein CLV64_110224 [Micromonospora phaseoli]SEJ81605.1 hypothetical protein SAMN05443287_10860 [Micromonospora phaseoli]
MASGNSPMKIGLVKRGQKVRSSPLMTAPPCGDRLRPIGGNGSRNRRR